MTKFELDMKIESMFSIIENGSTQLLRGSLQEIVPTYTYKDELKNLGIPHS